MTEAMATALPIISAHHRGIPTLVVDGITGFLVNEKDTTQLSKKMRYMVEHPELWIVMGHEGRDKVVKLFNNKKNERLIEILYEFINKK